MTKRIIVPCYVETNASDPANFADYQLTDGTSPFDIGILFAANLDGTSDQPVLTFNSELQPYLDSGVVAKLQATGLKVTLSILGNHQEAGLATLSAAGVKSLVSQLVATVQKYGLDGLDFDDEYSNGSPNPSSFIGILSGVRAALPDAILTMYAIGPVMQYLSYQGVDASSLLDYAWNPIYGTFSAPQIPGMDNSRLSPAAISVTSTPAEQASSLAKQTVSGGYGVCMLYNLVNGDNSALISAVSTQLFGQATTYTGS